jgi:hypothetical protein
MVLDDWRRQLCQSFFYDVREKFRSEGTNVCLFHLLVPATASLQLVVIRDRAL